MHIGSTKMRILSIFAGKSKKTWKPWKSTKSLKNTTFACFAYQWGGGVDNNLNDASHLLQLAESFLILYCTSCKLTEGSSRRYCTFTSSIRREPSRPGIVRTCKRGKYSREMCKMELVRALILCHICVDVWQPKTYKTSFYPLLFLVQLPSALLQRVGGCFIGFG